MSYILEALRKADAERVVADADEVFLDAPV